MSEHWEHYLTQKGEAYVSVFYDEGIAKELNQHLNSYALRIGIKLKQPDENGFPENHEFESLKLFGDQLEARIVQGDGVYLGRFTSRGMRWMLALMPEQYISFAEYEVIAKEVNYEISVNCEEDSQKSVYWDELYPALSERQVMEDIKVLNTLEEHGDNHSSVRPVDHWVYFDVKSAANEYCAQLTALDYSEVSLEKRKISLLKSQWLVKIRQEISVDADTISNHTTSLSSLANKLGGEYDGWETQVIKSEE